MKKLIIAVCICGFSVLAKGQAKQEVLKKKDISDKSIIDMVSLRCYYLFSKKKEGAEEPYRTDTMLLDVGAMMSKFYDPATLGRDSLVNAKMKSLDPSTIKSMQIYSAGDKDIANMPGTVVTNVNEGESYQIIKDKSTNKITVLDYTQAIGNRFKYEDETGALPWKITSQTDTVLSYACQKATLYFRGRNYTAWFTTEIPVSEGPWKFSGLPGLILKVQDDQGLFAFKLIGLERPISPLAIQIDDSKSIKCSRSDFEKLKKRQDYDMQINVNAGNIVIAHVPGKYAYTPMEIE